MQTTMRDNRNWIIINGLIMKQTIIGKQKRVDWKGEAYPINGGGAWINYTLYDENKVGWMAWNPMWFVFVQALLPQ